MSPLTILIFSRPNDPSDLVKASLDSIHSQGLDGAQVILTGTSVPLGLGNSWAEANLRSIPQSSSASTTAIRDLLSTNAVEACLLVRAGELVQAAQVERQQKRLTDDPDTGVVFWDLVKPLEEGSFYFNLPTAGGVPTVWETFLSGEPLLRTACLLELLPDSGAVTRDWNPWDRIERAGFRVNPADQETRIAEHLRRYVATSLEQNPALAAFHLEEAGRLCRRQETLAGYFARIVTHMAIKQSARDEVRFVNLAFGGLPAGYSSLRKQRSPVLAAALSARVFEKSAFRRLAEIRRDLIAAWMRQPSLLRNRGTLSLFAQSFQKHPPLPLAPAVIDRVARTWGHSIDRIAPSSVGTARNTIFLAAGSEQAVLHFSREAVAYDALQRAVTVNKLVRDAGVAMPRILASEFSAEKTGLSWTLETWSPGHPFEAERMRGADAHQVARELGAQVSRMHQIHLEKWGFLTDLEMNAPYTALNDWLQVSVIDRMLREPGLPPGGLERIQAACRFLVETADANPRLCHYDLSPGNLLVDGDRLSALIDWEAPNGGDPAIDVGSFYFWNSDEAILEAFLDGYQPADRTLFRRRIDAGVLVYTAFILGINSGVAMDRQKHFAWLSRPLGFGQPA